MKKKIFFSLLLMFSVIILFTGCEVYVSGGTGSWQTPTRPIDNGYIVDNLDITMDVHLDHSFTITEEITVDFGPAFQWGQSRGIYRFIPYNLTVTRDDGTGRYRDFRFGVDIRDLEAGIVDTNTGNIRRAAESIWREDGNVVILMREAAAINLTGPATRTFRITYTYNIGWDRIHTHDELYFNLLGDFWNTRINNVNFTINMPTTMDFLHTDINDSLFFYTGQFGSHEEVYAVNRTINDTARGSMTQITGSVNTQMSPFSTLTVRMLLQPGYFSEVDMTLFSNAWDFAVLGILAVALLIVIGLYFLKRDTTPVVETVEFYPPDGASPVKVKYGLDGAVKAKQMSALIIYWASKGYLKIIESNQQISLLKTTDLPSNAAIYEQTIFNALFRRGGDKPVTLKSLESRIGEHFKKASR